MIPEEGGAAPHSIWQMIFESGPIVQGVLYILIALSLLSWAISIAKYLQFRRALRASDEFRELFWESKNLVRIQDSTRRLSESPLVEVFNAGFRELQSALGPKRGEVVTSLELVERAMKRAEFDEAMRLEKGNTFLASVASAAPFIGLFGTVWGIMTAFQGLASAQSATIQAVAPGISEALIATAVGLAAAIPAAVAYNYFAASMKGMRGLMHNFTADFLGIARTYVEDV